MASGSNRSVSRIRTFNADLSSARGDTAKPGGPKLKKEKKTAQDKADAILNAPDSDIIPEAAKKLKRSKKKSSHEFLSANTDIPPVAPPPPKSAEPEVIPDAATLAAPESMPAPTPPKRRRKKKQTSLKARSLADELAQYSTKPKEIRVASSDAQKVKVGDDKLSEEVRQLQKHHTTTTTFEDVAPVSLRDDESGAVIIQNKKSNRFKLFPAIGKSMKSWASDKKEEFTKVDEPKHVVRKAESRLDTIARAAQKSYHAPQSDHGIVVKRLTKKKRSTKSTAHTIKKKESMPAPSWTHVEKDTSELPTPTTELPEPTVDEVPSVAAIEEALTAPEEKLEVPENTPAPEPVDQQLKEKVVASEESSAPEWAHKKSASDFMDSELAQAKKSGFAAENAAPPTTEATPEPAPPKEVVPPVAPQQPQTPVTPTAPLPPVQTQPVSQAPAPQQSTPTETASVTPEVVPPVVPQSAETPRTPVVPLAATPAPAVSQPAVTPQAAPAQEPAPEKTEEAPAPKKFAPSESQAPSRVPIYVYGLVILGASLLGIGTSVYWFMSSTPTQEAVVITIPSLVSAKTQLPVRLGATRDETYDTILSASLQTRETTQIYPTIQSADGTMVPADAATILSSLGLRMPGSFSRSVREITFGSVGGTDPFIVMDVTNFDTAFAGMLSWEPVMSNDLSPLFGLPVNESYDPYARTDTQIRSAFFRDTIASNSSARMLADANNTERILYTFVDQNTLVITTNSETLAKILPFITQ